MKCMMCDYWVTEIPCGYCTHEGAWGLFTSDEMVFVDSGVHCPLNIYEAKSDFMEIKNWAKVNWDSFYMIVGNVYGNPNFKDGTYIRTSPVMSMEDNIVITASGSVYRLGNLLP